MHFSKFRGRSHLLDHVLMPLRPIQAPSRGVILAPQDLPIKPVGEVEESEGQGEEE